MKALLLGGCAMALCAGVARADVTYTFTSTSYALYGPPGPSSARAAPLTAAFTLSDQAVASGSFTLHGESEGSVPPNFYDAESAPFTSFAIGVVQGTPTTLTPFNVIVMNPTFDAAGDITTSQIQALGESDGAQFSGSENNITAYIGSDSPNACYGGIQQEGCIDTGYFTHTAFVAPVPEPSTIGILAVSLIGLFGLFLLCHKLGILADPLAAGASVELSCEKLGDCDPDGGDGVFYVALRPDWRSLVVGSFWVF